LKISVGIIDYGRGNLYSLINAFLHLEAEVIIISDDSCNYSIDLLVIPGVGSFSDGMAGLKSNNLDKLIYRYILNGKFVLGICLGCQMLMSYSEEFGKVNGLGLIKGGVSRLPLSQDTVPHVGWKQLSSKRIYSSETDGSTIINSDDWVYFVHSYHCIPILDDNIFSTVKHGNNNIAAVIVCENIIGLQFHPEKSGETGLNILRRC